MPRKYLFSDRTNEIANSIFAGLIGLGVGSWFLLQALERGNSAKDEFLLIASAICFLLTPLGAVGRFLPQRTRERFANVLLVIWLPSLAVVLGSTIHRFRIIDGLKFLYVRLHAHGPVAMIPEAAVLAITGYSLYRLKRADLKFYANVEIVFALTSCYLAIDRSDTLNGQAVGIIGGALYLVVRGLDNRKKAIEEASQKPV